MNTNRIFTTVLQFNTIIYSSVIPQQRYTM